MSFRAVSVAGIVVSSIVLVASAALAQDAAEGEKVFRRQCFICHTVDKGGPTKQGPNLFGLIGRKTGSVEGFRYTNANKSADITWTPETLDPYLTNPRKVIPGTNMAFAGLSKEDDRKNLIAYLQTLK
ncbi:cytochrome c family protein [Reyranella sp. CPCC 100927]|uniref:c-type cytochrome n=1 Tax=Reyranella sp. CPCC 100927 TaxID=2599616 RepID=UPI0011B76403|nr:cytochrome c family protein [Reyranella sp. CPCC 100927]TWT10784.1 cytochrome c family protein [Reyranella sp. CPCC 100927]